VGGVGCGAVAWGRVRGAGRGREVGQAAREGAVEAKVGGK